MIYMKWLKKWSYLILLLGMGAVYLSCVDKWQVYAEPIQEAMGGLLLADGSVLEGEQEGGDPGAAGGQDAPGEPEGTASAGSESGDAVSDAIGPDGEASPGAEGGSGVPGEPSGSGNETQPPAESQPGEGKPGDGQPQAPPEGIEGAPQEGIEGSPSSGSEGNPSEGAQPGEVTYMTVEDDYFADAVFIGDSRTMGLFEYGGLEETAAFYASTGLTVYKMFEAPIVPGENGKMTVEEALQQNSFGKIYLCIGINEMGTGTVESFLEAYQEAVAHLRELQPDAIIYLQAIIKVTTERSNQGDYINNEGIIARNEGIARLADNEHVFFLDVNPLICDETGGMVPDYTFDGVHLKAVYIDIWKEYLKAHAVSLFSSPE